jgi:hypothetical protein
MSLSILYWLCLLLLLVGGAYVNRTKPVEGGISFVAWLALLAIGWKVFGAPLHG